MPPFGSEHTASNRRVPVENPHKLLVKVRADHYTDGTIRPLSFTLPDGTKAVVDRLVQVRQAASLLAGGQGMRYHVRVTCGEETRDVYLFDDEGVWFVEQD